MDFRLDANGLNAVLDTLAPPRRKKARFVLAASVVAAALVMTVLGQWLFGSVAGLFFAVSVVFCTAVCGLVPGLLTSAASALTLDFLFIPPIFRFNLDGLTLRVAIIFGALAGGTHLVERLISARIRSRLKPPLGMHGSIDGIEHGELYGWAMDADNPSRPVEITLLLDKHPVAQVAAVYHRPDVAQSMSCSGCHGFYIDLEPYFPSGGTTWVDVRLPNGQPVTNAGTALTVPAIAQRLEKPTVIFMHIPKTAGTAFREAIAANFLQSEIAYQYPEPPGFLATDLRALPLEQRRRFRMVIGHVQFGIHEALPQRSDYITIVREPVARVLSQYAYMRLEQPELLRSTAGHTMSLPELLERPRMVNFDNLMVRCFSGVDEADVPPGALTREIFERACENLRRHFTFVGHQEEAGRCYAWLCRHYGWQPVELPERNRSRVVSGEVTDPELSVTIRAYNTWDMLLYEEILRIFPRIPA